MEDRAAHPHQQFPRVALPPPPCLGALTCSSNKVAAWSLTSLSATSSCTNTQLACVAAVFLFLYFVVRKVRGTEPHISWTEVEKENDGFSHCALPSPGSSPIVFVFVLGSAFARLNLLLYELLPVCACLHDILPSKTYPPAWLPRYAAIVNMADTRTRGSSRSPARGVRNRSRSRERERPREREANENKVSIDREKV